MVKLTQRQLDVLRIIEDNPGIRLRPIYVIGGFKGKSGGSGNRHLKYLLSSGLVRREGNQKNCRHYVNEDAEYELSSDIDVESNRPDQLLERAKAVTLTDDQRLYLKNHMHLPRTKLAKRLGINKLALNLILIELQQTI